MEFHASIKATLVWGFVLWFVGYAAGILLFFIVPEHLIGWVITPFATAFTIWVLRTKIQLPTLSEYIKVGIIWTVMAVVLDYLFLVLLFRTGTAYYKPDVFLYYGLTFILPPAIGSWKRQRR